MGIIQQKNNDAVKAFKRNDPKILRAVYVEVFPKIRAHVLQNSGSEEQAKDVFQEAFIACWKNIKEDRFTDGNISAYLFTIAKNKWTDVLRSSEYKKTVNMDLGSVSGVSVEETGEGEQDHEEEQQRSMLETALAQLGEQCRTLLKLFYFNRKSMEEIAGEIGLAPSSARNQKYRCMEKLRGFCIQIKNNGR